MDDFEQYEGNDSESQRLRRLLLDAERAELGEPRTIGRRIAAMATDDLYGAEAASRTGGRPRGDAKPVADLPPVSTTEPTPEALDDAYVRRSRVAALAAGIDVQTFADRLGRPLWQQWARCRGAGADLFVVEHGGDAAPGKTMCRGCVVAGDCLAYALADGSLVGTWAGTSLRDRRAMRAGKLDPVAWLAALEAEDVA